MVTIMLPSSSTLPEKNAPIIFPVADFLEQKRAVAKWKFSHFTPESHFELITTFWPVFERFMFLCEK